MQKQLYNQRARSRCPAISKIEFFMKTIDDWGMYCRKLFYLDVGLLDLPLGLVIAKYSAETYSTMQLFCSCFVKIKKKGFFIVNLETCCLQLYKRRNSFRLCSSSSWLLPTQTSFSTPKSKQFFSACQLIKKSCIASILLMHCYEFWISY